MVTSVSGPLLSSALLVTIDQIHFVAMVYVDNKVALRQLEIANAELLSHTSLRSAEGTSLAKDGKFHPRVLTLVRLAPLVDCSALTDQSS